ncbi:hypothetical protein RND71_012279 [Anisodus tanguticus]|uniref:Apple domain-containing protein n=1 Tax=Anisodus tanguticus TaxID=243964 RepID=A0AAE1SF67_9SOLA|nr:hypothetical protein RND71_012279 [Anisodus tanguticus]
MLEALSLHTLQVTPTKVKEDNIYTGKSSLKDKEPSLDSATVESTFVRKLSYLLANFLKWDSFLMVKQIRRHLAQGAIPWKGSLPSGPFRFSEMPAYVANLLSNFTENDIVNSSVETTTGTSFKRKYTPIDFSSYANYSFNASIFKGTRLLMNSSGEIQFYSWDKEIWYVPKDKCDVYRECGKFEICNSNVDHGESVCRCLPGFKSDPPENNYEGEYSGGCSRISVNSCQGYTFVDFTSMKSGRPDRSAKNITTSENCRRHCLGNCTCQAYTYSNNSRCYIWGSNLNNLQENYTSGFNLSIRVPHIGIFFLDLACVHK